MWCSGNYQLYHSSGEYLTLVDVLSGLKLTNIQSRPHATGLSRTEFANGADIGWILSGCSDVHWCPSMTPVSLSQKEHDPVSLQWHGGYV